LKLQRIVRHGRALSVAALAAVVLAGTIGPLAAQAAAQAPAAQPAKTAPLPEARTIIDRHIAAVGGRDAMRAHSSSHVTGRIEMPANGLSGPFEMFAARPNLSLMRMTLSGVGDLQEGFDGKVGWMQSAMTGPMLTEGRQLEQKKFDADFYSELKDPSRYKSMTTVERTTFDGRDCYKVRLVSATGVEDIEYYEVESGLKAGGEMTRESPMGAMSSSYTHRDYKKFGKLIHPATQKISTMGVEQILTIESIEYDTVDPKIFELPAAIKALVK
jgi:hypothetical protein